MYNCLFVIYILFDFFISKFCTKYYHSYKKLNSLFDGIVKFFMSVTDLYISIYFLPRFKVTYFNQIIFKITSVTPNDYKIIVK